MKLNSISFENAQSLNPLYAFCKLDAPIALSDNKNPQLSWTDIPEGTKSFALILKDVDVPSKGDDVNQEGKVVPADLPRVDFTHWLLANIPANCTELGEGEFSNSVTAKGKPGPAVEGSEMHQGINNYTDWFAGDPDMAGDYYGYDGPCPPWNDEVVHRYLFTLYALDVEKLSLGERFTREELLKAMEGHILAKAYRQFSYTLNPKLSDVKASIPENELD